MDLIVTPLFTLLGVGAGAWLQHVFAHRRYKQESKERLELLRREKLEKASEATERLRAAAVDIASSTSAFYATGIDSKLSLAERSVAEPEMLIRFYAPELIPLVERMHALLLAQGEAILKIRTARLSGVLAPAKSAPIDQLAENTSAVQKGCLDLQHALAEAAKKSFLSGTTV